MCSSVAPRADGLGRALQDLLVGHDVAFRALQVGPERAEGAAVDADVGRVEMRVDVVIGDVAVLALADEVGQFAEREQVGLFHQEHAVVEGQPFAGQNIFANRVQGQGHSGPRIVAIKASAAA